MAMVAPALHVSEEVKSTLATFAAAAPAPAAAFLSVDAPSATITLQSVLAAGEPGTASLDDVFGSLAAASQNGTQPVLALVCKADANRGRSSAPWFCVSFIPEGVPPRQKMLLATAREELKRAAPASLGVGPDYQVTELEELTPAAFDTWSERRREDAMSSRELEVARVEAEANAMRMAAGGARVASMATVQFTVAPDVVAALHKLVPPRAPTPPPHAATASATSMEESKAYSPAVSKEGEEAGEVAEQGARESKLELDSPARVAAGGEAATSADTSASSFAPATPLVEVLPSPGDEAASAGQPAASPLITSPLASSPLLPPPSPPAAPLPPPSPPAAPRAAELNFVECAVVGAHIVLLQAARLDDSPAALLDAMQAAVKKPAPTPAPTPAPLPAASPMRLPGLAPAPAATEPRFFVFTLTTPTGAPSAPVFVYYCPSTSAHRARMSYSTAKACLVAAAEEARAPFGHTAEASDADDLAALLQEVQAGTTPPPRAASSRAAAAAAASASASGFLASPTAAGVASPSAALGRSPSGHGRFASQGAVPMPGLGGHAPRTPSADAAPFFATPAPAPALASDAASPDAFSRPGRPGRGGARVMGFGLPGMTPPTAK